MKPCTVCLLVVLAWVCGERGASALELNAPTKARTPAAQSQSLALPPSDALTGPLTDSDVGRQILQVEVDSPVSGRGAGGAAMEQLFAARCRSVVFIASRHAQAGDPSALNTGTGSIVSADGLVLTAAHVVDGNQTVAVGVFPSCQPGAQPELFPARVVRTDPRTDLALLRLLKKPAELVVMPLGRLDEIRTGSNVVMIGHPRNLLMSMSLGLVSAVRPDFNFSAPRQPPRRATVIQTDGALNPGNSGGPMMSTAGHLVGVNSFILGQTSAGLNFAVSVTDVRAFLASPTQAPDAAARPPAPPASKAGRACVAKTLKEWREGAARYKLLDLNCKGKGTAILMTPDDRSQLGLLSIDRNGDSQVDVRFHLNAAGNPVGSEWDDDFDGVFDFRGKHLHGEWEPASKIRLR